MATTSSNSHSHPVKVGSKTYTSGSIGHQHTVPDQFTAAEVIALRALITATPEPVPDPVPEPAPPPPTGSRPFPAPTTTRTVTVQATDNLQQLVSANPDGTRFVFPTGVTFTVVNGIYLRNRHHLVFDLNGSTIKTTNQDGSTTSSPFKLDNENTDIAIRGGTLQGSNPNTGSNIFTSGTEYQMGVCIFDGQRIELDRINVRNVYGDGLFVAGKESSPQRPSEGVWCHDSTFDYVGRMGVVPKGVRNFIFERNRLDHVGLIVLDIECDYAFEVVDGIHFLSNTIGSYSLSAHRTNWFFACAQATGSGSTSGGNSAQIGNLNIEANHVSVGPSANANNPSNKGGLASIADKLNRIKGLRFVNNTSTKAGIGLYFEHIDGLTVYGNTQAGQPIAPTVSDCTNVRLTP